VKLPVAPAEPFEEALFFWFRRRAARPAFHDLKSEKAEQQLSRGFQIEPQILGNLLHGTGTIELRRELGLV
jgi:hypothetical protein